MEGIEKCIDNNRRFVTEKLAQNSEYFTKWAEGQAPPYLWVGCSDSRVVPNDIIGMRSGDVFVHRNVGNVVSLSDINCMSVLEYSVGALKVKHIIVCGHYGCGACKAAQTMPFCATGYVNGWICNIRDVRDKWAHILNKAPEEKRARLLVELNALEQAKHVCHSQPVQTAWNNKQELHVHVVVYDIATGYLNKLASTSDMKKSVIDIEAAATSCILKTENLAETILKGLCLSDI